MKRLEQDIMLNAEAVAKRDFPEWVGSPWKLKGLGSEELDALLAEAVASREPIDLDECDRLDREMRDYAKEGR